jgi:hypothetical protein
MTPARPANVAASVPARLLNVAKAQGVDFNQVLVRFALERILYRLAQSQHAERFLLKGALLFTLWYDMPHRATRDADLLGFGASDLDAVAQTFREIAAVAVDDGIAFDPASLMVGRRTAGRGNPRHLRAARHGGARNPSDRSVRRIRARSIATGTVAHVSQEERACPQASARHRGAVAVRPDARIEPSRALNTVL